MLDAIRTVLQTQWSPTRRDLDPPPSILILPVTVKGGETFLRGTRSRPVTLVSDHGACSRKNRAPLGAMGTVTRHSLLVKTGALVSGIHVTGGLRLVAIRRLK